MSEERQDDPFPSDERIWSDLRKVEGRRRLDRAEMFALFVTRSLHNLRMRQARLMCMHERKGTQ